MLEEAAVALELEPGQMEMCMTTADDLLAAVDDSHLVVVVAVDPVKAG